ncbi:hypothetical protein [Gaoshiqia sediminis]|uniref:Uncharacterized protein n=1 Tax=Gaoshiqia sediminis TaxID=2986998 RepID=A0AA41Y0I3_9BACT|nr:hypothetical protein [Gaoshiqia sediminis]MCW0481214.1 hypothetical protein [Gaoshiqia sediminis]
MKAIFRFTHFFLFIFMLLPDISVYGQGTDDDYLKIGGAVRFNIIQTWYESEPSQLNTAMTWDTWRLNIDARKSGIDLSFEYRFYPTFGTHFIHHGYMGYGFSDKLYMSLGVSQVPFGIQPFASHSWWFQGPYYVGLEDDYDMGIKFDYQATDKLKLSFAYFRQAEPEGPFAGGNVTFGNSGPGRYSYDIIPGSGGHYLPSTGTIETVDADIRELDHFNFRAAYQLKPGIEVGASAQLGSIYNSSLNKSKAATAFAAHIDATEGRWNFKGEFVSYNYQALDNSGLKLDLVQMGAYGSAYDVAAKANMYVAGLAYSIPVDFGPVTSLQAYLDYTLIDKLQDAFADTHHLIPGCMIAAGNIYMYVDYAMGKNQPWLTDTFGKGLGMGDPKADWNKRLNINIGYYF